MCWVQLLTSTIQFLCVSITETLLHMTMKRQAEISADIVARLLPYFSLSYKNLTIICGINAITDTYWFNFMLSSILSRLHISHLIEYACTCMN